MVVLQSVCRQFSRQPSFVLIHILSATVSASATTISERWWLQRQAKREREKGSDQLEGGGRGYLRSRGRGWELLSRQQRARRGSVGRHKVLPARRPASHWRQPQLILGAPRQPPSCPATCSWVWIARLLLQTPPSPSPFCNLQHLEPEENDYSLHSVVLLLAATTLMIFIKKDRVSGASVTSKSSLYSAQQGGCL